MDNSIYLKFDTISELVKNINNLLHKKIFKFKLEEKKSHTCEEGGAHFRVSVWHLLMNFDKQLSIKKTLEVGQ